MDFLSIFSCFSGHLKSFHCSEQLHQIMRHTNQQPFRFDLLQATQQKLPKASDMFDLGKDWLDDYFSLTEDFPPHFASQLVPHPLLNIVESGGRLSSQATG